MTDKYKILKEYQQVLIMCENLIGSGTTDNIQLNNIGMYIFGNDYLGTFSSDKMPKNIKNDQCFILNTDSSRSSNKFGHWVGFYKLNGKLYYYDSFSRSKSVLTKLWKNKKIYNANKTDIDQAMTESNCGSRAISWLIIFKKYGLRCIDVI
ncbi:MAG: hypothetical protein WCP46_05590 [Alphaproteobacteria bacterium]